MALNTVPSRNALCSHHTHTLDSTYDEHDTKARCTLCEDACGKKRLRATYPSLQASTRVATHSLTIYKPPLYTVILSTVQGRCMWLVHGRLPCPLTAVAWLMVTCVSVSVTVTATVNITITPVNDNDPVAVTDAISVAEGGTACVPGPFGAGKTVFQQSVSRYGDADVVIDGDRIVDVVEPGGEGVPIVPRAQKMPAVSITMKSVYGPPWDRSWAPKRHGNSQQIKNDGLGPSGNFTLVTQSLEATLVADSLANPRIPKWSGTR